MLAEGHNVEYAMKQVGRARKTYEMWRAQDETFREQIDNDRRKAGGERIPVPDFPEFCQLLGQPLFPHQLRWWDVLCGREPRDLHPSMVYERGRPDLLLVNVPPEHAKTTTLTVNYVTWRIYRDPNVKCIVASKTEKQAKKMLYGIKARLTHPSFRDVWLRYGPPGGWKADAEAWTTSMFYVGGKDDGEKDPTVEALGMGGQIYGSRADLIILDDTVLLSNVSAWESQIDWLTQEVISRLPDKDDPQRPGGTLIIAGTRVASVDLYKKIRETFPGEFTYLAQPAVLEYAEKPEDWVTLWPWKWPGAALERRKRIQLDRTWALAYQQLDVEEDAVFPPEAVRGSITGMRGCGPLVDGAPGHRRGGMAGLWVVAGLDPAAVNYTAMVVYAIDRQSHKRYVLEAFNKPATTPHVMRQEMKRLTELYGINEWRVEKNAYQQSILQDEDLVGFMHTRGCHLRAHHTGSNKWDADFGVASMAPLFLGALEDPKRNLIDLPNPVKGFPVIEELIGQLVVWDPENDPKRVRCDLVMALWFCEIAAKELLAKYSNKLTHLPNRYLPKGRRALQTVVNLQDIALERMSSGS